jgi:hypothetical protein
MIAADLLPTARLVPTSQERVLRRLRRVVRRRVRVDMANLGTSTVTMSDGSLDIRLRASGLDPRVVTWEADRPVDLVVLYTGCGMRLAGRGGLDGELVLPATACVDAYLAFCYDDEVDAAIAA